MMKYLLDNGFKVLTINQLGYDTTNNIFYLNNAPRFAQQQWQPRLLTVLHRLQS
jgi:hypothetical protein